MATFAVTAPDGALFYRKGDPHDRRLGDLVAHDHASYPAAAVVLLGCPTDEGVRRNGGRPGAAAAPAAIRRWLYRLGTAGLERLAMVDLGDTIPGPDLETTHDRHRVTVAQVIADGKRLIILGGGNDVAYPDVAGLADAAPPVLAINVDAHYDVRADWPRNSGTPYRQLLDERHLAPERFAVLGAQPFANSPVYTAYLERLGARVVTLREARLREGVVAAARGLLAGSHGGTVFWGFDMDVVAAADAPGVSAPNPLGMSGEELCALAELAGADPRTRLVELSEVNPSYDLDDRTSRLAAAAIWYVLSGWAAL
ncbi:MAG: formimidoylglutamase [Chloroflexales bacterium]|nr:formimidoylglutamase [Chloroflexales bacterium]